MSYVKLKDSGYHESSFAHLLPVHLFQIHSGFGLQLSRLSTARGDSRLFSIGRKQKYYSSPESIRLQVTSVK